MNPFKICPSNPDNTNIKEVFLCITLFFALSGCVGEREKKFVSVPQEWLWDTCRIGELISSNPPAVSGEWQVTPIPHRFSRPNQAIWYAAVIESSQDKYLFIDADDGAQVFFNQKHYPARNGYYYKFPDHPDCGWLHIRVLNNAKQGGLNDVRWLDRDSMDYIWSQRDDLLVPLEDIFLSNLYRSDVFLPEDGHQVHDRQSVRFTCWGDSQGGWGTFHSLCNYMLHIPKLEFSIGLGNLVSDGVNSAQWFSFLTCLAPLIEKRVQIFAIPGIHDYHGYYDDLFPVNYRRHFTKDGHPTYTSWSAGPAIFMTLDPNNSFPPGLDAKQYSWAIRKMRTPEWKQATWRFILIHQPPYAQGWSGYTGEEFIRSFIDFHAEKERIDFVLSGHCHDFEYLKKEYGSQKTHFIVTGGGGGDLSTEENNYSLQMDTIIKSHHYILFDVNEQEASLQVYNHKNHLIWTNLIAAAKP